MNFIDLTILPFTILFFFAFLAWKIFSSKPRKQSKSDLKGIEGERKVNDLLKKRKLVFFSDVLLELGTHTTQIDHLVIFSDKTVLVIETKNKDGMILGSAEEQNWTQSFPQQSFQFYNPLKQNEGHIRFLHRFCDQHNLHGMHFINLVVFTSNRCKLKKTPENTIHLRDLESFIDFYERKSIWNRSRRFSRMIRLHDHSKNKRKVRAHINFAKNAKKYKKKW